MPLRGAMLMRGARDSEKNERVVWVHGAVSIINFLMSIHAPGTATNARNFSSRLRRIYSIAGRCRVLIHPRAFHNLIYAFFPRFWLLPPLHWCPPHRFASPLILLARRFSHFHRGICIPKRFFTPWNFYRNSSRQAASGTVQIMRNDSELLFKHLTDWLFDFCATLDVHPICIRATTCENTPAKWGGENLHKLAKSSGFRMKCDHATNERGREPNVDIHLNLFMNGNWVEPETGNRIICMHLNALLSHLIGHLMAFKHKKASKSSFPVVKKHCELFSYLSWKFHGGSAR